MSKYFGFLNKEEFLQWEKKKQVDYLVEQKACQWLDVYKILDDTNEVNNSVKQKKELSLTQEVIDEVWEYLMNTYEQLVAVEYNFFFKNFNDDIFGRDRVEQREIALQVFNEIYDQINSSQVDIVNKRKGKGMVERVENMNRFKKLNHIRQAKKINLCPLPIAMEAFYGNEVFFNSKAFADLDFFKDAINFEASLKVLVNLNDEYQFEDDLYFSEYGELKEIFNKYSNIFLHFDSFVFTHKAIQSFKDKAPSQIESLYAALVEKRLIAMHKSNFMKYTKEQHFISLSKLRSFEEGKNREHDLRVKNFLQDLSKYSIEK